MVWCGFVQEAASSSVGGVCSRSDKKAAEMRGKWPISVQKGPHSFVTVTSASASGQTWEPRSNSLRGAGPRRNGVYSGNSGSRLSLCSQFWTRLCTASVWKECSRFRARDFPGRTERILSVVSVRSLCGSDPFACPCVFVLTSGGVRQERKASVSVATGTGIGTSVCPIGNISTA